VPFTLRNLKGDLEHIGSAFDGAPDLQFGAAAEALELEKSGLTYQRVPVGYRFPYGLRAAAPSRSTVVALLTARPLTGR
jgi:hypothetical protein